VDLTAFVTNDNEVDLTFTNCWFDDRAQYGAKAVQCGDARFVNCDWGGQTAAVMYAALTARYARVTIEGGNYRRVVGAAVTCSWNAVATGVGELWLTGDWRKVATPYAKVSGSGAEIATQVFSDRRIQAAATPASGLVGDIAVLWQKGAAAIDSYRCVTSGNAATWKARTTLAA
jgi:hypothetical protein